MSHQDQTKTAYGNVVDLYASMFDNRLESQPFTRSMLSTFAELIRKNGNLEVADVGCGPGHITALLHELGLDAFGLDLSPAMIEHAQHSHAGLQFSTARMESLPIKNNALGGILAHYSMIHTPPKELPALFDEQARVLVPGGLLMVSFFTTNTPSVIQFDHKVAPAYSWPVDQLAAIIVNTGFKVVAALTNDPENERGFLDAHLILRRD